MNKSLLTGIILCLMTFSAIAQNNVTVDFNKVVKSGVPKGAAAVNICWLLDSDLKRPNAHKSMEDALTEVGVGSLRFPYGHLADNYLWHTPPYDDVKDGLRPKIATTSRPPAKWSWVMNTDGSYKNAMDFDEYMALCQRHNIKPLVVVNLLSFKYDGGPTLEELATSAAEWVKYAKKKNYEVAYWQLGNEIDHHPKIITLPEFVDAYKTIASAMKQVDPNANIGPGILGKQHYFVTLYKAVPHLVDFTSCHQYMFSFTKTNKTYDLWSKSTEVYIPNVLKMQRAINNVGAKDMDIVITETGVTPAGKGIGDINNAYKALWWFEVLMSELRVPDVKYSYFWGTHSPWKGEKDDEKNDVGVMFRMDNNASKPIGEVSKLVNTHLHSDFVSSSTTSEGLRVFSMVSADKKEGTIFIMNKLKTPASVSLNLRNIPKSIKSLDFAVLSGENPHAVEMNYQQNKSVSLKSGKSSIEAAPLSISVLTYKVN